MLKTVLLFALSVVAFGQQSRGFYTVEYGGTLSASTQSITIQLPTSATSARLTFNGAQIYNSAACDWRLDRDGALATGANAVTPTKQNSYTPAAVFEVYRSSNVGTAARNIITYKQLTGIVAIDLGPQEVLPGETLTFTTPSACTGDYRLSVGVIQSTF